MTIENLSKLWFQEFSIIKPLLIHHIAIDVIMEDLDLCNLNMIFSFCREINGEKKIFA